MRKIYRIYVLGETPPDLKEKIAAIHASAILACRKYESPEYTQDLNKKNDKRK
jgi:hypothetical protein